MPSRIYGWDEERGALAGPGLVGPFPSEAWFEDWLDEIRTIGGQVVSPVYSRRRASPTEIARVHGPDGVLRRAIARDLHNFRMETDPAYREDFFAADEAGDQ